MSSNELARGVRWLPSLPVVVAGATFALAVFLPSMAVGSPTNPGNHSILLGKGSVAQHKWFALAERKDGSNSPRDVCLTVRFGFPRAETGGANSCGPLTSTPILLSYSEEFGGSEGSILAMAFVPRVYAVRLELRGRPNVMVKLRRLSVRKALKARLVRFRYGALAIKGQFCLKRFVTYARDGSVIDPGESMPCPPS